MPMKHHIIHLTSSFYLKNLVSMKIMRDAIDIHEYPWYIKGYV